MTTKTTIIIVSKSGTLSECQVEAKNETTIEELTVLLSKKCGYRNHDGFSCYHTWRYKNKKKFSFHTNAESESESVSSAVESTPKHIYIDIWGKTDGRSGNENKYEIPPPIDELLFFGNLAFVARIDKEHAVNLTIELWTTIYEKLFGGFEDLAITATEDDNESDELAYIPDSMKTINGYLKDGFVVEDDSEDTPRVKTKSKNKKISGSGNASASGNPSGNPSGKSKKNKSESTESEFITETETETDSVTPSSDSSIHSDADADADVDVDADADTTSDIVPSMSVSKGTKKSVAKRNSASVTNKPKRTIKKQTGGSNSGGGGNASKKTVSEEVAQEQEIESELSEDTYD